MIEIWKDIIDYDGLYQASNFGRIKSLDRQIIMPNGGIRFYPEKIMLGCVSDKYIHIRLSKNGITKTYKVHRLVYEAFNGKTNLHIDHKIEGNKLDNRLCNLQAITNRQNSTKYHLTKNKSSQYVGVNYDKNRNKWVSEIQINGNKYFLGRFNTEIEAHNVYQLKLLSLPK